MRRTRRPTHRLSWSADNSLRLNCRVSVRAPIVTAGWRRPVSMPPLAAAEVAPTWATTCNSRLASTGPCRCVGCGRATRPPERGARVRWPCDGVRPVFRQCAPRPRVVTRSLRSTRSRLWSVPSSAPTEVRRAPAVLAEEVEQVWLRARWSGRPAAAAAVPPVAKVAPRRAAARNRVRSLRLAASAGRRRAQRGRGPHLRRRSSCAQETVDQVEVAVDPPAARAASRARILRKNVNESTRNGAVTAPAPPAWHCGRRIRTSWTALPARCAGASRSARNQGRTPGRDHPG